MTISLSGCHASYLAGLFTSYGYRFKGVPQSAFLYISATAFNVPKWFHGDFMWITFMFYGGFFAGVLAIVALLWAVVRIIRLLALSLCERMWGEQLAISAIRQENDAWKILQVLIAIGAKYNDR